ncbi:hypothetical protein [Nocardia vermiculata]|uniref:Uncharacterized protein n=1 Tax=Nocardia vermiculata TaxID=257274 RepID=A0A846Y1G6_9NOCA|nr:hypothetical protein [Nocardia vermiculata]NKY51754.1 hypothetical protein [Nocardia vermiculata]
MSDHGVAAHCADRVRVSRKPPGAVSDHGVATHCADRVRVSRKFQEAE